MADPVFKQKMDGLIARIKRDIPINDTKAGKTAYEKFKADFIPGLATPNLRNQSGMKKGR